jgi:hypothetical protein
MQEIAQGYVNPDSPDVIIYANARPLEQNVQLVRVMSPISTTKLPNGYTTISQQFNEIMPCIYSRFMDKEARQWREIYKVSLCGTTPIQP